MANEWTLPGLGDDLLNSKGAIANGAVVAIQLNTIFEYLRGTIAVTGGTGIKATLLEYR